MVCANHYPGRKLREVVYRVTFCTPDGTYKILCRWRDGLDRGYTLVQTGDDDIRGYRDWDGTEISEELRETLLTIVAGSVLYD